MSSVGIIRVAFQFRTVSSLFEALAFLRYVLEAVWFCFWGPQHLPFTSVANILGVLRSKESRIGEEQ